MTEKMRVLLGPPRKFNPYKGWVLSTFVVMVVLSVGVAISEKDFAMVFFVPFIMLPFALIFTFPTVFFRRFLNEVGAVGFVAAGASYALLLGLIPDLDLVDRNSLSGWFLQGASGSFGGLAWWLLER